MIKKGYLSKWPAVILFFAAVMILAVVPSRKAEAATVNINSTNFPDSTFREAVKAAFDTNKDGKLGDDEIQNATKLDVSSKNIASIKGIEYLTALIRLYCYDNPLGEADFSKNTELETLYCQECGLQELDVTKLAELKFFVCGGNYFETVDISKNSKLQLFGCDYSNLGALDTSHNPDLIDLNLNYSPDFTGLDISCNTKLKRLSLENCATGNIDVSHLPLLESLSMTRSEVTEISVASNPELVYLMLGNNDLKTLDVSKNKKLEVLYVDVNTSLSALDVSQNTALRALGTSMTNMTSLDVSKCSKLEYLSFNLSKQLSSIKLGYHPSLSKLVGGSNALTSVNISGCKILKQVYKEGETETEGEYELEDVGWLRVDKDVTIYTSSAPVLKGESGNRTVAVGDTAKFTVTASGSNLKYQWYYRLNPKGDWRTATSTGAKTAAFSFTAAESHSGHQYKCEVSNDYGPVTSSAMTLTVTPKITKDLSDQSVAIGNTVKFKPEVIGTNLKYQWYYQVPSALSESWKKSTMACATTDTFSFTAEESHSGHLYRCEISNGKGTVYTKTVKLTVRPRITTQPAASVTVPVGGTVKLTTAAKGTNLTYQWQYRNSSTDTWKNSTMACAKTNTFTFTAAENHSGHQYRCKVSNGKGTTPTNVTTVTVTPKITTQPKDVLLAIDSTVKLTVAAKGTNLTYQWQYRNSSKDTWKNSTMACAKTNTFTFKAAEGHSGHQYRCLISNGKGTAYSDIATVTVRPLITTQPKDTTVSKGATVKLTVAAKGTNLTYRWQYRNSSTDTWKNSTMACAKTSTFSFTAAASHSGHQYRCAVSNGKGTTYTKAATLTVK